ncbi:MAG: glycosyltransferase family 4 protein [Candidatus Peregrinibacteria bacterium]|nr:glycosyltransferase family 4 protein [Candidatus Peregrinibacteria bacterium]
MKRILLYTDTPLAGGAEIQMFLLAKFLDKKKFTPILALSSNESLDKLRENFDKEGIKVIRINAKSKHNPIHYLSLKRIIAEEKIDILHLNLWNPASCRYGFLAGKSAKIPMIVTEHDPFELTGFKNAFKKYGLKAVSKIVTVSLENQKLLKKLFPEHKEKIEVIQNGIDTDWWQSQVLRFAENDRHEIKTEVFRANEDTLIIISVAELHERKGLKYLIKAVSEVKEKYPNIKLVIVGEGPNRKNLENLIEDLKLEDHVILLGRRKEIPKLLKSSNIFVLPSRREAFGLVNLEAMITPLPVIASAVGGIPEIIKNGETGILVKAEDEKELAKALETLISDSPLREKMAEKGFLRVKENFSAQKMAEKYEKLYSELG